jgi:hypothetical protein
MLFCTYTTNLPVPPVSVTVAVSGFTVMLLAEFHKSSHQWALASGMPSAIARVAPTKKMPERSTV